MARIHALAVLALVACSPARPPVDAAAALAGAPPGSFLSGTVDGLDEPVVVNRRDFVYAVAFDDLGKNLAFVHHVTTHMELTAAATTPIAPKFQQPVNVSEFDVEDVAFAAPEGGPRLLAVPSRQGVARLFDAETGALVAEHALGVPLVRVAVDPSSKLVAFGATDGTVMLLDARDLAYKGDAKLHRDEVHGLVFVDGRTLLSTSWDATLVRARIDDGAPELARVPSGPLKTGERLFLAHLPGSKAIATTRDVRQPTTTITRAAVQRLALATVADGTTLPVQTAEGEAQRPVVELGELRVRRMSLGTLRAAVCDECVPAGAELALGRDALSRALFTEEVATGEVVVRPGRTPGTEDAQPAETAKLVEGLVSVVEEKRQTLPGPGTDVDVAADGRAGVVTFSHVRAQRTFDIHDDEKKGRYPDPAPNSAAALFDATSLQLGNRFVGHRGWTVTGGISPDGKTIATGGWDKRVLVWDAASGELVTERKMSWLVRRARFSPDGAFLAIAAWTPSNPTGNGESEPALVLYPLAYASGPTVVAARR